MIHYLGNWTIGSCTDHYGYDDETDELCFLLSDAWHCLKNHSRKPLRESFGIRHDCLLSRARDAALVFLCRKVLYEEVIR